MATLKTADHCYVTSVGVKATVEEHKEITDRGIEHVDHPRPSGSR